MSRWNPFRRLGRRGGRRQGVPEDRSAAPTMPAWDGGWRRSAPQDGVLGRGGLGIIQPARFRSSVASFRDHGVLGGGLGHRLAADAPAGTMHGLVRSPGATVQRAAGPGHAVVTPAPLTPNADSIVDLPLAAADPATASSSGEAVVTPVWRSAVRTRRLAPPLTRARPVTGFTPRRLPAAEPAGTAAPPLVQRTPSGAAPRPAVAADEPPGAADPDLAVERPVAPGGTRPTPEAGGADSQRPALGDPIQRLPSGAVPLHRDSATGEPPSEPMPQATAPEPPPPQATAAEPAATDVPQRRPSRRRPTVGIQRATSDSTGSAQAIGAPLAELPKSATPLGRHASTRPQPAAAGSASHDVPAVRDSETAKPATGSAEPASGSTSDSAPLLGTTAQVQRLLREAGTSAARQAEQDPPAVVKPGTGGPDASSPGATPPVQRVRRSPRTPEDLARPRPTAAPTGSAAEAGVQRSTPESTDSVAAQRLSGPRTDADSAAVQRSSTPTADPVPTEPPPTGPVRPIDPPTSGEQDTEAAVVQRLPAAESPAGTGSTNTPASPTTGGAAQHHPSSSGDSPSHSTASDRPETTAPLVGDSPVVQRVTGPERNPDPPAPTSGAEPTTLATSGSSHVPGRPGGTGGSTPATGAEASPIQRTALDPNAVSPSDLVVPQADRPENSDQSAVPPDAPATRHDLPLPTATETAHSARPVQRMRPLIATRPLPVRTHPVQAGPPTPPARTADAPAVAPLRWTRPDEQAPAPPTPPRIANPPPVQRSSAPAPVKPISADLAEPVAPQSATPKFQSTVDDSREAPRSASTPPPLAVQRHPTPPAQPQQAPPAQPPTTSSTEAKPQVPGVPPGVPVTVVPKEHEPADNDTPAESDGTGGQDIDELARRLIEPVGRLLRTELRHGRERFGRTYDRRR
ncbi:hypothetical protein [Saccharopolyspora gloriosae]|uniref:hypothetical protein n=1 Tax=Saccharopolyspora gloriosae TaxID=455344 RepID=UPI001FB7E3EC|nr:hypothetical protein [Saccharopolyspora gloriosae]